MSDILSVVEALCCAFSDIKSNITYVAWSSGLISTPDHAIAANIINTISKRPDHGFVAMDANGYSLMFEGCQQKLALFTREGNITHGSNVTGTWYTKPTSDGLPAPRDLPFKRAQAFMRYFEKSAAKRPTMMLVFKSEDQGDVTKYIISESSRICSSCRACLVVVTIGKDGANSAIELRGSIMP